MHLMVDASHQPTLCRQDTQKTATTTDARGRSSFVYRGRHQVTNGAALCLNMLSLHGLLRPRSAVSAATVPLISPAHIFPSSAYCVVAWAGA
jgi:hypothetical protein